jgi:hypothetical protein
MGVSGKEMRIITPLLRRPRAAGGFCGITTRLILPRIAYPVNGGKLQGQKFRI